jgi:hypothetical protein
MIPPLTIYEIRVAGQLSPQWIEWFTGLAVTLVDGETWLTGPLADQAALHGVLKKIRDLGLPLLSVNQLPPSGEENNPPFEE